jgi:hypothetical protein
MDGEISMLIRKPTDLRYSDVTPKEVYLNRRQLLTAGTAALGSLALPFSASATKLTANKTAYKPGDEKITSQEVVTHWNNYYEFGTGKETQSRLDHHHRWRGRGQTQDHQSGPGHEDRSSRGAHLSAPLR